MTAEKFYQSFIYIQERFRKFRNNETKKEYKYRVGYSEYNDNHDLSTLDYVRREAIEKRLKKGMFYFYFKSYQYMMKCKDITDYEKKILAKIRNYESIELFAEKAVLNVNKLLKIPQTRLFYIYILAINSHLMRNFSYFQNKIGVGYSDKIDKKKLNYKNEIKKIKTIEKIEKIKKIENEPVLIDYNIYHVEDDSDLLLLTEVEVDFLNTFIVDILYKIVDETIVDDRNRLSMSEFKNLFDEAYNSKVNSTREKFNKYIFTKNLSKIRELGNNDNKEENKGKGNFSTIEKHFKTLYSQVNIKYYRTGLEVFNEVYFNEFFDFKEEDILEILEMLPYLFYRNISPKKEIELRKKIFILPPTIEKYKKSLKKILIEIEKKEMVKNINSNLMKNRLIKIANELKMLVCELSIYEIFEDLVHILSKVLSGIEYNFKIDFYLNKTGVINILRHLNFSLEKLNSDYILLMLESKQCVNIPDESIKELENILPKENIFRDFREKIQNNINVPSNFSVSKEIQKQELKILEETLLDLLEGLAEYKEIEIMSNYIKNIHKKINEMLKKFFKTDKIFTRGEYEYIIDNRIEINRDLLKIFEIIDYKDQESNIKFYDENTTLRNYLRCVHKENILSGKITSTQQYQDFNKFKQYFSFEKIFTFDDYLIENIEFILKSIGYENEKNDFNKKIVYIDINGNTDN